MIFTMIGGGAHRLLSTARSALREGVFAKGGEMRFYDLNQQRSADMAAMVTKSPEYRACPIKISWDLTLDEALKDADVVSVTLLAGSVDMMNRQTAAGYASGFIGSDNISYPGAFLALRGAPILMNVAKRMQVMCPNAILLDFANPVSVLTAMVRQFTGIQCYGICEGHNNHQSDLTRLLTGENRKDTSYEVDVAGINHLSFITRGTFRGEDIFKLMDERLAAVPNCWEKVAFPSHMSPYVAGQIQDGLHKATQLYQYRHALLFSSELDGFGHFFQEAVVEAYRTFAMNPDMTDLSGASKRIFDRDAQAIRKEREAANAQFAAWAKMPAEEIPWNDPLQHVFHVPEKGDVQVKILCGLVGIRPTRVAVSSLNDGNILNLEDGIAAEFTHIVDETGLHPLKGLRIPTGVLGLVSSLAIHQTLLAKACGTGSAKDLYEALLAYPTGSDTEAAKKLWRFLLHDSAELIAPSFMELENYLV